MFARAHRRFSGTFPEPCVWYVITGSGGPCTHRAGCLRGLGGSACARPAQLAAGRQGRAAAAAAAHAAVAAPAPQAALGVHSQRVPGRSDAEHGSGQARHACWVSTVALAAAQWQPVAVHTPAQHCCARARAASRTLCARFIMAADACVQPAAQHRFV